MFPKNAYSLGGQIMAIRQKEESIKNYYLNPKICKNCNKIIEVKPNEKVSTTKRKHFCSKSCAGFYYNKDKIKNKKEKLCIECNKTFLSNRMKNGLYSKTQKCPECLDLKNLSNRTKKELFEKSKNWQSARSSLRRHASKLYEKSDKPKQCAICGYSKHYEVSHIKSVSSFSDNTLISEINHIDNLIALCPTHHWEYDHNKLDKPITDYIKEQNSAGTNRTSISC